MGATTRCQVIEHHFGTGLSQCQGKHRKLSRTQAICVELGWDRQIWCDLKPAGGTNLEERLILRTMTSNLVEDGLGNNHGQVTSAKKIKETDLAQEDQRRRVHDTSQDHV